MKARASKHSGVFTPLLGLWFGVSFVGISLYAILDLAKSRKRHPKGIEDANRKFADFANNGLSAPLLVKFIK